MSLIEIEEDFGLFDFYKSYYVLGKRKKEEENEKFDSESSSALRSTKKPKVENVLIDEDDAELFGDILFESKNDNKISSSIEKEKESKINNKYKDNDDETKKIENNKSEDKNKDKVRDKEKEKNRDKEKDKNRDRDRNEKKEKDKIEKEEIDPLDAYMDAINNEAIICDMQSEKKRAKKIFSSYVSSSSSSSSSDKSMFDMNEKVDLEYDEEEEEIEAASANTSAMLALDIFDPTNFDPNSGYLDIINPKKEKRKDLPIVDHKCIDYLPFTKNLYVPTPEIKNYNNDEIMRLRLQLEGIKVRGRGCPCPITKWSQSGLDSRIINYITQKLHYASPTPIQGQVLPALMSGRDVIGIAKTGSGKTMGFVLPMLRHILAQSKTPDFNHVPGPIGLIIAPTRELCVQIYNDCQKVAKQVGLVTASVYGGSNISEQIAWVKKGSHIIVCTPGRMIELLCANNGNVTNLQRTTYVVLDEADRMMDLGFMPQVVRILGNIRPDKQTMLFSATFPRQLEALIKNFLSDPLQIVVGKRSVVCSDVTQHVFILQDSEKFHKLVELLKKYEKKGQVLIFVKEQNTASRLFAQLVDSRISCLPLHGGQDQADRDSNITDFKEKNISVLIATSVAARGLDVKGLVCVINYDCPDHLEDYVHRVGRTGRAGEKGDAYTFITEDDEKYSVAIMKALKQSAQEIPRELEAMCKGYGEKVKMHLAFLPGTGFGGKGYKFDEEEESKKDPIKKQQKQQYGIDDDEVEEHSVADIIAEAEMAENAGEELSEDFKNKLKQMEDSKNEMENSLLQTIERISPSSSSSSSSSYFSSTLSPSNRSKFAAYLLNKSKQTYDGKLTLSNIGKVTPITQPFGTPNLQPLVLITTKDGISFTAKKNDKPEVLEACLRAAMIAEAINLKTFSGQNTKWSCAHFREEMEINDLPQIIRFALTNKNTLMTVMESTGTSVIARGRYIAPQSRTVASNSFGGRKLYLNIEGDSLEKVRDAKAMLVAKLREESGNLPIPTVSSFIGRFNVVGK
jgi:ATP-dependent RNA helicase DDX46/PRP5